MQTTVVKEKGEAFWLHLMFPVNNSQVVLVSLFGSILGFECAGTDFVAK